jgi:hypothetical protein
MGTLQLEIRILDGRRRCILSDYDNLKDAFQNGCIQVKYAEANPGLQERECGNAILLDSLINRATVLRCFIIQSN